MMQELLKHFDELNMATADGTDYPEMVGENLLWKIRKIQMGMFLVTCYQFVMLS